MEYVHLRRATRTEMIAKPVTGPSKLMHEVGVSKEQGFSTWRTLARSVLASEVSDWREVSRGWMEGGGMPPGRAAQLPRLLMSVSLSRMEGTFQRYLTLGRSVSGEETSSVKEKETQ